MGFPRFTIPNYVLCMYYNIFSYIVDDGCSVAIVTLTGSDIMKLLGLSHDQWLCLEEETRNHGEVFIQQVMTATVLPAKSDSDITFCLQSN